MCVGVHLWTILKAYMHYTGPLLGCRVARLYLYPGRWSCSLGVMMSSRRDIITSQTLYSNTLVFDQNSMGDVIMLPLWVVGGGLSLPGDVIVLPLGPVGGRIFLHWPAGLWQQGSTPQKPGIPDFCPAIQLSSRRSIKNRSTCWQQLPTFMMQVPAGQENRNQGMDTGCANYLQDP